MGELEAEASENAGEEEREERGSEDAGEGDRDSESRFSCSSSSSEDESSTRSDDLYSFVGVILRTADEANAMLEVFKFLRWKFPR